MKKDRAGFKWKKIDELVEPKKSWIRRILDFLKSVFVRK